LALSILNKQLLEISPFMLLLPPMKVTKHIVFRFLFLIAVLFSLGVEVYSNYTFPTYNMELSEELNVEDNNLNSDIDSFDDDHINQTQEKLLIGEKLTCLTISNNLFIIPEFSFSNWQPPQKSPFRI